MAFCPFLKKAYVYRSKKPEKNVLSPPPSQNDVSVQARQKGDLLSGSPPSRLGGRLLGSFTYYFLRHTEFRQLLLRLLYPMHDLFWYPIHDPFRYPIYDPFRYPLHGVLWYPLHGCFLWGIYHRLSVLQHPLIVIPCFLQSIVHVYNRRRPIAIRYLRHSHCHFHYWNNRCIRVLGLICPTYGVAVP